MYRTESDWKMYREMTEELEQICANAILSCESLPNLVKENESAIGNVEIFCFDASYLEHLAQQIELGARGEDWAVRLKKRKSNIESYVNRELADCRMVLEDEEYTFTIDPVGGTVVHWEYYDYR